LCAIAVEVEDCNLSALGGEGFGDATPDALPATRDHRDFPCQAISHRGTPLSGAW
jgi:hypothetical protein